MGFFWVGFVFWTLIIIGLVLLFYGLFKQSRGVLILSGFSFLLPMLYFLIGANNCFKLLALVPLLPFILAIFSRWHH